MSAMNAAREDTEGKAVTVGERGAAEGARVSSRAAERAASAPRPLIVGIGGTTRPVSSTEQALKYALGAAESLGARTLMLTSEDLDLPMYDPAVQGRSEKAVKLVKAVSEADGVIVASPGYHGSVSGLVKNALDYLEDLREAEHPYLDGRAVGCIVCVHGWQAGGITLAALRSIVHALRGWPTPLGVAVNSADQPFVGGEPDSSVASALRIMASQVVDFANGRAGRTDDVAELTGRA